MGNMYNMLFGANIATFLIYPTLFENHPDSFPRFRDCFVSEDEKTIKVYSRMGGGNRECWEAAKAECDCPACQANEIENQENCISRIDDDFDSTYCTFSFKVPEKYKNDVELIMKNKLKETSKEYKDLILKTFPKIEDKLKKILF